MDKNVNESEVVKDDNGKLTVEDRMMIKELEDKIVSMKADKEKKCKSAKEQLIEMLEVTIDKYRTATGTAEALRVLRFCGEEETWATSTAQIRMANNLAYDMAMVADHMKEKAKELNYAEMDKLCDGFYDKEFNPDANDNWAYYNLAFEMMKIDLCRNVGPAAEDMVEFIKRVEHDIDDTGKKLKELKTKEKK